MPNDSPSLRGPHRRTEDNAATCVPVASSPPVRGSVSIAMGLLAPLCIVILSALPTARMTLSKRGWVHTLVAAMLGVSAATLLSQAMHGIWVWLYNNAPQNNG